MKRNSFWSIIALCVVIHGGTILAMEKSESWYDWAASKVNSGVDTAKYLYDGSLPSLSIPQQEEPILQPNQVLSNGIILAPWKSPEEEKDFIELQKLEPVAQEKSLQEEKKISEKKEIKQSSHNKEAAKTRLQQATNTNSQNIPVNLKQVHIGESKKCTIQKNKFSGTIYDETNNITYFIDKRREGCIKPGVYLPNIKEEKDRTPITLESKDGRQMVKNQLENLFFSDEAQEKMNKDRDHNFPQCLEKHFGEWARVIIQNPGSSINQLMNSEKKFTLIITIPGRRKNSNKKNLEVEGVFEFVVKKSLYEEEGECTHRLFKKNGVCGAEKFGSVNKNNTNTKNNTNNRPTNK